MVSLEQIRLSKGFRNTSRVLCIAAVILGASTFIVDKFLPYRIGPNYYALYLWVETLAPVALAVVILSLFLGVAARQWFFVMLALLGLFFIFSLGMVHSGPNPEAWCFNNLRTIDGAKNELAEKNNLTNGTVVTSEQISPYIQGGFASLKCVERGEYIINPIGIEPRCTFHGSMSEMEAKWKKLSQ